MFTLITSFFHSVLLIFKLAAITALCMILVESCGYTSSPRRAYQPSLRSGRSHTARVLTTRNLARGNPLSLSKCAPMRIPSPHPPSQLHPEAPSPMGETVPALSPLCMAPARSGNEKRSKREHQKPRWAERRRSRASTLSSDMTTESRPRGGRGSSSRSSSRAANVGTSGVASIPPKSRSRERRGIWRRERSSSATGKSTV